MEDVTQALFLSFAVMVLVIALSVSINTFSQARQTSDMILRRADETTEIEYEELEGGSNSAYRIVGLETIIPNLYRYNKENLRIVFMQGSINSVSDTVENLRPLTIYVTQTNPILWNKSYVGDAETESSYGYKLNSGSTAISVFDTAEENSRLEPWQVGDESILNKNINAIINGDSVEYKIQGRTVTYNYAGNPLTNSNSKYAELISRETERSGNKTTKLTTITYVKIN